MTNTYEVEYGQDIIPYDQLDEWQRSANPWTLVITTPKGRKHEFAYFTGCGITDDPEPEDILSALRMDAEFGDRSFEEFCEEFGYDTDSRRAERTWKTCQRTKERLRSIGEPDEPTEEDYNR